MASGEKTYKSFSAFITNCVNTFISLLKVLIKSRFGLKLPRAVSDSCIVLGNGPSLNRSLKNHPDFFKKHPIVCVNNFSVSEKYEQLQPAYYIMLDPLFWLGDTEIVKKTLESLTKKTTWKLNLLLPQNASNSVKFMTEIKRNSNIAVSFFNYTVFKGFEGIGNYLFRKNLATVQSQNVIVTSLFISINLGFKSVYLLGADHNWHENLHLNENNQLCLKDVHFYDNAEQVKYRLFYKDEKQHETFRMHEIMIALGKAFYGYEIVKRYADRCNATVYNASEISFIDAFKRIKL